MEKRKKILNTIGYWVVVNIGTLLLAAGVYFFKAPNNFATGGVSGLAIILQNFIPLNQSYIMLIINSLLLIIGFIVLGKECTAKTIYCSLVYSLENLLFSYVCPLEKPLTDQPILELVYAILLTGIGSAILFNCKASSGGTDIVALILKKYTPLNVGRALLLSDFLIASSTFFIFGLFSKAFLVDGVIESVGKSKYLQIITSKPNEIGDYIINTMKRDFTSYVAEGGYTRADKTILITVCKQGEALRLKAKVKELDPSSFVIICDATEILGKGFRETN
jgi:uncharacterized membrane-anchored protein YitT (DUF2179 family)